MYMPFQNVMGIAFQPKWSGKWRLMQVLQVFGGKLIVLEGHSPYVH
jgi:hypothetical protein